MPSPGPRAVKASPISLAEFAQALLKIWRPPPASAPGASPPRIGLGVSGGSDSMALAFLFSELNRVKHDFEIPKLDLRAFIIDHGARAGSAEEAGQVSGWMDGLGISSNVFPISWSANTSTSKLSNFETLAREARRELWKRACHDQGINSLFLAHHRDDQAETILYRLYSYCSAGSVGLRGMAATVRLFGPNLTGMSDTDVGLSDNPTPIRETISSSSTRQQSQHRNGQISGAYNDLEGQILISQGPITLYRPFLPFPKARLISTCQSNNIPFVTDTTNFDPTFSARNAIRHLFSHYALPKALREDSLISLGKKAGAQVAAVRKKTDALLSETRILFLDLRSGTVHVRVPSASLPVWSSVDLRTAVYYLRNLLRIAIPASAGDISIQHGLPLAQALFPHVRPPGEDKSGRSSSQRHLKPVSQPVPFTIAGVLVSPLAHSLFKSGHSRTHAPRTPSPEDENADDGIYILTRAPFSKRLLCRYPKSLLSPAFSDLPTHSQPVTPTRTESLSSNQALPLPQSNTTTTTSPVLPSIAVDFDDRFSFHFPAPQIPQQPISPQKSSVRSNQSGDNSNIPRPSKTHPYLLRPLLPEDIATLPEKWKTTLHDAAPGKVRFTLPAVVRVETEFDPQHRGPGKQQTDQDISYIRKQRQEQQRVTERKGQEKGEKQIKHRVERVLGLPTLGLWRDGHGEGWKVRYKALEFEALKNVRWGEGPSSSSSSNQASTAASAPSTVSSPSP